MSLISLIITIALIGFILWAVNTYVPMDARVKSILGVVVVIALVLWLLHALMGGGAIAAMHFGP